MKQTQRCELDCNLTSDGASSQNHQQCIKKHLHTPFASTKTMRIDKILVALLGVAAVAPVRFAQAKANTDLQRHRGRRTLLDSKNSLIFADYHLPRALGVNAVSHGPKKSKANSGSDKGSGKGGRSDKHGDDDDDSDMHTPTESPFSPDEPTPPHTSSHGSPSSKQIGKVEKDEKPSEDDSKETKGSKLQKSGKTPIHKPTTAPIAAPSADAPAPGPTVPPSASNLRVLSPYQLVYTLSESRVPFRSELLEVVELTRVYLQDYFVDEFEMNDDSQLEEFLTIFLDTAFDFGEPIPIEYESSAVFDEDSDDIPSTSALDEVLASAFEGNNLEGYVGMLQALPNQNLFSNTLSVELTEPTIDNSTRAAPAERGLTTAAAAMAGTTGLLLILAGAILRRRHAQHDDDDSDDEMESFSGKRTIATATVDSRSSLEQMIVPVVRTFNTIPEERPYRDDGYEEEDGDGSVSSMCNPLYASRRSR